MGGSYFCRTVPKALMTHDKKLLLLPSSVPACPGFQLAEQVLHPTPSSGRQGSPRCPGEKQQLSLGRGFTDAKVTQGNLAMGCEAGQGVRLMDRATPQSSAEGIK